ncbi:MULTISPECIES: nitroreductase family protein [Zymobacter]|uniref:Putative NAD(P)H nitroreductase n=1 Tax=Zymobacter palmae TaxID=33074 RepID=A0A348HCM3_9GAMM|nr:nitroreductase family protein [Zymobacter palmae]BBG29375.1 nitroreductase [Zymobacter palmae]
MQADTLLLQRRSCGRLTDPAPSAEQLDLLYRAALRAPDHGALAPFRFVEISGEGRATLGRLMAASLKSRAPGTSNETLAAVSQKPLTAPLIIAVIARVERTERIPRQEQVITAGCAAHAMLYAAYAQDLGAFWRTGDYATDPLVRGAFELKPMDELVGFIYLGTPATEPRPPVALEPADFIEYWS